MKFMVSFLLIVLFSLLSFGSFPNDKIIITDVLDDDIRAITHLLIQPTKAPKIKAFITTTGNVYLKAAILRKIVHSFGFEIPVYEGTSTDLTEDPITQFAGRYEKEGYPILSHREIDHFKKFRDKSGDGANQLAKLMEQSQKAHQRLDSLLLTAPIDLVTAIDLNPKIARMTLADLFAMGLFKKNAKGELVGPYNTRAGPESVVRLLEHYQNGIFERLVHVASDVVQNSSGLPYGYVPMDSQNSQYNLLITKAMKKNPILKKILHAAEEYGLNWRDQAVNQFGPGVGTDLDRWVPDTLVSPEHAARFYLADMIPSILSTLTEVDLNRQSIVPQYIETPVFGEEQNPSFQFFENKDHTVRPLFGLTSFDGMGALREHIIGLQSLPSSMGQSSADQERGDKELPEKDASAEPATKEKSLEKKAPLVMVFKNSPDDWFGLTRIISLKAGVASLAAGGIICEGFHSEAMAINVKAFLKSFGLPQIPVAVGSHYGNQEVENITNFKLERAISEQKQDGRAFTELVASTKTTKTELTSVDTLLTRVNTWSSNNQTQFDVMILGEGIDVLRFLDSHPETRQQVGDVFVMGGGRIDQASGRLVLSRNWLPHRNEVIQGLDQLGEAGKNVFIFSSNEFGGSIVSTKRGKSGNGDVVFNKLEKEGKTNPALQAVYNHWINWSRVFSWVISKGGQGEFDPQAPIEVATISPLGLFIADEWISGDLAEGESTIEFERVSLSAKISGESQGQSERGVAWLKRSSGQEVVTLAKRFGASIGRLARNAPAQVFDSAVRQSSIFDGNAIAAFKNLDRAGSRNRCQNTLGRKK